MPPALLRKRPMSLRKMCQIFSLDSNRIQSSHGRDCCKFGLSFVFNFNVFVIIDFLLAS